MKKYKAEIDSEGYYTGNYATYGRLEKFVEVDEIPSADDISKLKSYRYDKDSEKLVYDEEKHSGYLLAAQDESEKNKKVEYKLELESKIQELKKKLSDTDYQISKCTEAYLTGNDMPYDVELLHETRQSWRDEINQIENEIKNISLD